MKILAEYDGVDLDEGNGEPLIIEDESKPLKQTSIVFTDEDVDEQKLLKTTARNRVLPKQNVGIIGGAQAVAVLTQSKDNKSQETDSSTMSKKIVFTEMEEFVTSLQVDEENVRKNKDADAFVDEEAVVVAAADEEEEDVVLDETIHKVPARKGLSGVLKLLKERGSLEETVEWGGRNTDKKQSKLVGINNSNEAKEIRIDRFDESGRRMTQKEQFRKLSHAFHGKEPGKKKKEKRIKQAQEELKRKKMKNSDTPSLSVKRMREAQARLQTPYLVDLFC